MIYKKGLHWYVHCVVDGIRIHESTNETDKTKATLAAERIIQQFHGQCKDPKDADPGAGRSDKG